jgi:hypothetical protein
MVIVVWPEMMMSTYINDFQEITKKFGNSVEFYYAKDRDEVRDLFNVDLMPPTVM